MLQLTDTQEKQFLFEINKGIDVQSDNEAGMDYQTIEVKIYGLTLVISLDINVEYELERFATRTHPAEYKMFKTIQEDIQTDIWDNHQEEFEVTDDIWDAIVTNLKVY